jgi:hypothetical protein
MDERPTPDFTGMCIRPGNEPLGELVDSDACGVLIIISRRWCHQADVRVLEDRPDLVPEPGLDHFLPATFTGFPVV